MSAPQLTGRCYCGAVSLSAATGALTVTTCHCSDCRRLSGAPSNTFAAFNKTNLQFQPPLDAGVSHSPGVRRWFCQSCGTPLAATYDYLPGQTYVPVGLFDQVDTLVPESQSHTASRVCWVAIDDSIPQSEGSGRETLKVADGKEDS